MFWKQGWRGGKFLLRETWSFINCINFNTLDEGKLGKFNEFNHELCLAVGRSPIKRIQTTFILYIPYIKHNSQFIAKMYCQYLLVVADPSGRAV
jgi:hypothetical protein